MIEGKLTQIPYPREQSGFFHSLWKYRGSAMARFFDMQRTCPDMAGWRMAGQAFVLVRDPAAIEEILVSQQAHFKKDRLSSELSLVLGDGIFTAQGADHRRQRKLIAPAFSARDVAAYVPVMLEVTHQHVQKLKAGSVVDVHQWMMRLTLDVLVACLFGRSAVDHDQLHAALARATRAFLPWPTLSRLVTPHWLPLPSRLQLARVRKELRAIVEKLVVENVGRPDGSGLVAELVAAQKSGQLSRQEMLDQVTTLLVAGHETTALTLSYALKLLSDNPLCRTRAEMEVDACLAPGAPDAEGLRALSYMHAVVHETLRLYPPAWLIGREPIQDVVIGGHHVPKGTQMLIPIFHQHRDPRWFEQPTAFRPERFIADAAEPRIEWPRFAYLPFGGGPRVCVGNHFALLELTAVLTVLLGHARFDCPPDAAFDVLPSVTLRPKYPLQMSVSLRHQHPHEAR